MLLHHMAMLIVDGEAASPWEAAGIAERYCQGASQEARRKRLSDKYIKNKFSLESNAVRTAKRRSDPERKKRLRETARAFSEAGERYDAEKLRIRQLIESDHELMQVVEHLRSRPDEIMDWLPHIMIHFKKVNSDK